MSYRVDNLPLIIRVPLVLYSYSFAAFLFAWNKALYLTTRREIRGGHHLTAGQPYLYCFWHEGLGSYFTTFLWRERPHAWMAHPLWYMWPIHILNRWMGLHRMVLGSAGNEGRAAADELILRLREGYSTMINPDGPAGPPHVLKKGVLHISKASGVPIVPVRFLTPHPLVLPMTWDRKRFPLPFTKLIIEFGEPRVVTDGNFEECREWLEKVL